MQKISNILEVRNLVWILDFSHEFPNSGLQKQSFISFNINFIVNFVMLPPTGLLIVSVIWRDFIFF